MTASALNTASPALPGAAAHATGGANAASPGAGALSGFEALLAALFPQGAPGGAASAPGAAVAAAAKSAGGKGANLAVAEPKDSTNDADDKSAGDDTVDDANADQSATAATDEAAALAASLVATPATTTSVRTSNKPDVDPDATSPALPPGKAGGKPFLPAGEAQRITVVGGEVANAATADDAGEDEGSAGANTPKADGASDKSARIAKSDAEPLAWGRDKLAGQPAAPALQHAQSRAVEAKAPPLPAADTAQSATEVVSTDVAPEAPQAVAAAQEAPQQIAETTPKAQSNRPTKAERAKDADAEVPAQLKPTEAVDRPAFARAADAAARPAAATANAASADDAKPKDLEPAPVAKDADIDSAPLAGESRANAPSLTAAAQTAQAVRGSPETVAALAAQIVKKLDSRSSRFDLELHPAGLGKVDVRLDISAHGRITASLTCDNPHAAAELKARANELQRTLEQAGFDLSGGLSFDVADNGRQQGQAWQDSSQDVGGAFRGQAFRAALETADEADTAGAAPLRLRRGVNAGLDLRI